MKFLFVFGLKLSFFLLERCISGAARGVGISKVSYMTSITVYSGGPLSVSSQSVLMSFMSKFLTICNIYHIPNSLFVYYYLPKRFVVFEDSEKRFYLRDYVILYVHPGFVCFGSSLL